MGIVKVLFLTSLLHFAKANKFSTEKNQNHFSTCNSRPNIILIVADDLGFNDVPWHNKAVIAPNIKKLALNGVILENSYVQPVCSPTRSALLSGRYPFTIGRQNDVIWPLMPTGLTLATPIIPQLLKPLGYETHAIGKWHLGFCNWSYTPTERGFDTFYGYYTGSEDYYSHYRNYYSYAHNSYGEGFFQEEAENNLYDAEKECSSLSKESSLTYGGYDFRNNNKPDFEANGTYSTYLFASRVEKILKKSKLENPKFIYMAFQSVHSPLQVPDNYTKPYKNIKDKKRKTYLGMVSAMDEAVGRIINALKESKLYNNSVIIFTTDNGGPTVSGGNNWPLRGNKTTLWEGGTRGAAFVHSPLLANPGTVSHSLIHTTDWLSTVVSLGCGSPPKNTDGFNQWEAINGRSKSVRSEIIYNINYNSHRGLQAGIRVKNYKLLVGDPGPGEWTPPPEAANHIRGIKEEKPIVSKSSIIAAQFSELWSYRRHVKFVKEMLLKCSNDECIFNILTIYQEANGLIINKKSQQKLIDIIKRKRKTLRKFLRKFGVWNNKGDLIANTQKIIGQKFKNILDQEKFFLKETNDHLPNNLTIRLYNLKDDPDEKNNLAQKEPVILTLLLDRLLSCRDRWVPPDEPKDDPKGNPSLWGGLWSPGWC